MSDYTKIAGNPDNYPSDVRGPTGGMPQTPETVRAGLRDLADRTEWLKKRSLRSVGDLSELIFLEDVVDGDIVRVEGFGIYRFHYGVNISGDFPWVVSSIPSSPHHPSNWTHENAEIVGAPGGLALLDYAGKMQFETVATHSIESQAVVEDKIAENAVTTLKIANGSVTTEKLAERSVDLSRLSETLIHRSGLFLSQIDNVKDEENSRAPDWKIFSQPSQPLTVDVQVPYRPILIYGEQIREEDEGDRPPEMLKEGILYVSAANEEPSWAKVSLRAVCSFGSVDVGTISLPTTGGDAYFPVSALQFLFLPPAAGEYTFQLWGKADLSLPAPVGETEAPLSGILISGVRLCAVQL